LVLLLDSYSILQWFDTNERARPETGGRAPDNAAMLTRSAPATLIAVNCATAGTGIGAGRRTARAGRRCPARRAAGPGSTLLLLLRLGLLLGLRLLLSLGLLLRLLAGPRLMLSRALTLAHPLLLARALLGRLRLPHRRRTLSGARARAGRGSRPGPGTAARARAAAGTATTTGAARRERGRGGREGQGQCCGVRAGAFRMLHCLLLPDRLPPNVSA